MDFKCVNCGWCCGPVPVCEAELLAIKGVVSRMPRETRETLASQDRGDLACMFRDVRAKRCSIYSVRPLICRMFGQYEGLLCPRNLTARAKPKIEADALMVVWGRACCGILSATWDWQDFLAEPGTRLPGRVG